MMLRLGAPQARPDAHAHRFELLGLRHHLLRNLSKVWPTGECPSAPVESLLLPCQRAGGASHTTLSYPCKLAATEWISSGKGTPLTVTPLKWRICFGSQSCRVFTFPAVEPPVPAEQHK